MAYSIDLSGRVAFITGASSGLGAQFARTLSAAGAAVVLASRRLEKLKELRAQIEGEGGDAHVIELDVTDRDSIKSAVAHAETEVGWYRRSVSAVPCPRRAASPVGESSISHQWRACACCRKSVCIA